jgi:P22 coat protein - gene protein 5
MANTITAYAPTIIAKTISVLRDRLALVHKVTTDYDSEMLPIGATLQIPVTAAQTAADITPAATAPALISQTPTSVSLTLNKFKRSPMSVTTSDLNSMMRNSDFVPAGIQEGCKSIANQITDDLFLQYKNVPYYVGTAGTNPFASSLATLSLAAQSMDVTLADDVRSMIISNAAKEKALELGNLIQAFQRGQGETLNTGKLGELLGFDMQRDSRVPTHTAGTSSGTLINSSGVAVGDTSVAIDTGTGTLVVGDVFTVAGDTQTYVVTTAVADVSSATMYFYPAAKVAWANNAAVTVKATHVVNLGLDRGAFALGMRQPRATDHMLNEVIPFRDDQGPQATGMEFALSYVPGYWSETIEVCAFYGSCTLRPERAVRMAG